MNCLLPFFAAMSADVGFVVDSVPVLQQTVLECSRIKSYVVAFIA
jgi:hypothetical protein